MQRLALMLEIPFTENQWVDANVNKITYSSFVNDNKHVSGI